MVAPTTPPRLLALCFLGSFFFQPSVATDQSCPNSSVVELDCTSHRTDRTCWQNCGKVSGDLVAREYNRKLLTQCSCDARCLMYGDCCPDYLQACNATIETDQTLISAGRCLNTYFPKPFSKFYFVADCHPKWILKTITNMCRNETGHMSNIIPVTDISANISYTNVYCAMCNFVRVVKEWNTTARCVSDLTNFCTCLFPSSCFVIYIDELSLEFTHQVKYTPPPPASIRLL